MATMLSTVITQELEAALRGLRYGSIQLVVHDTKVVRIERVERIRLPAPPIGGAPACPSAGVAAGRQAGLTGTPEASAITEG